MFFTKCRINLCHDFGLHDVKDRQFKGNTRERPCPCRVAMSYGLSIKFRAVGIGSTYDDNQVVLSILFNNLFDTFLTLQVKGTSGCSHKALGLNQQWLSPSAFHTCRNGLTLYSITLTKDDDLLTL
jgi:hypothetical protein